SSKHLVDARIDAPAQVLARAGQTQRHNCGLSAGCRGVPIGALLGKRLARLPNDFDRSDDPTRIFPVDFLVSYRIPFGQLLQKGRHGYGLELRAQRGVSRRRVAKASKKRFEIKSRSPTQDRQTTARLNG